MTRRPSARPRRPPRPFRRGPAGPGRGGEPERRGGRSGGPHPDRSRRPRRGAPGAADGAQDPAARPGGLRGAVRASLERARHRIRRTRRSRSPRAGRSPAAVRHAAARPGARAGSRRPWPPGEEPGYSPEAVLRRKSFEDYSPADLAAMERLLARLALRLATRPSRRRVPVRGRGEVDLRRSFRRAVAHGGEFLSLARRARPIEKPRLVVLCDTSGSMDPAHPLPAHLRAGAARGWRAGRRARSSPSTPRWRG